MKCQNLFSGKNKNILWELFGISFNEYIFTVYIFVEKLTYLSIMRSTDFFKMDAVVHFNFNVTTRKKFLMA